MCKSEMKEKHCVFGLLAGALLSVSCALLPSVTSGMEKESQAQRDFGRARWMWPHELGCATNTVVEFRTGFSVASPQSLRLAIAADTVYSVSLNGSEPLTGRFPNVPPVEFYDVLDIGECRAGENSLTVKLYVQGIDSFQYMPGRQGVMFSLAGNGVKVNSGMDVQWRLSRCDRSEGVVISTPQLGFSFEYDANAPVDAWKTICAEDLGPSAKALNLIRRPVHPCVTLPEVRERIVAQGRLDGSQVNAHPAKGMDATAMTFVRQEDFFEDDCRTVRQKWFNDGFYVIVDLGREEAGLLSFDIETDAGTVIDVGHAEHMEDGRIKVALRSYFCNGKVSQV